MKSVIFHLSAFSFLLSIFWVPFLISKDYVFISFILWFLNIYAWSWMLERKWHY